MREVEHAAEVECHAWKAVFAECLETGHERLHRRTHERDRRAGRVDTQQRIRFLDSGCQDAARAVVLEAARDDAHPVRKQRRPQRVTVIAGQLPSVEPELDRAVAVDPPALREPV